MTNYSIDDLRSTTITTGLQGYDYAREVAQSWADRTGEAVHLYEDDSDEEGELVEPRPDD